MRPRVGATPTLGLQHLTQRLALRALNRLRGDNRRRYGLRMNRERNQWHKSPERENGPTPRRLSRWVGPRKGHLDSSPRGAMAVLFYRIYRGGVKPYHLMRRPANGALCDDGIDVSTSRVPHEAHHPERPRYPDDKSTTQLTIRARVLFRCATEDDPFVTHRLPR